jgi:hypothetical protein
MEYLGLASINDFIKTSVCGKELIELIVTESNGYYQKIAHTKKYPSFWLRWWRDRQMSIKCIHSWQLIC